MPVHPNLPAEGMIFQRDQYAKPGIGRRYWDWRDDAVLKWVSGDRILDVGCGEGLLLEKLLAARHAPSIIGVDIEYLNVAICRDHNLPVIRGTAADLPFRDASFDTVLLIEVIEHLRHPQCVLRELFRVLAPGGRLLVLFPNDTAFAVARLLTGYWREALYDPGHCRQWRPDTCKNSLQRAGFAIADDGSLPFDLWPFSLHHLVVAEKPASHHLPKDKP